MSKDNGGPAFPVPGLQEDAEFNGMSLRDYLAIRASEEDVQYQIRKLAPRNGFGEVMDNRVDRSQARYAHADAMLEARK